MYKGMEENEVAHMIDESIHYYAGELFGYDDCWMFKRGELSNRSIAMKGFNEIEREIGTGILKEVKKRAIDETNIDGINYVVVPCNEVIDVYETYEHNSTEMSEPEFADYD